MIRIAGVASHGGTNLRHIHRACNDGSVSARLALLVSNNSKSPILKYARSNQIAWRHMSGQTHPTTGALDRAMTELLLQHDIDYIFLSGYMKRLGPETVDRFRNRILNIHPSLLPRHGGQGMYGDRVYEAVLASGDEETGATLHLVDEEYDHGPVVLQNSVKVRPSDSLENLRSRVREAERRLCLQLVSELATGNIDLAAIAAAAERDVLVANH